MERSRLGFTLVEVTVGLAVAGLVLLTAHALSASVHDLSKRLHSARLDHEREMNARRWLADAFQSLQVGQDSADSFDGRPDALVFTARILTEGGWPEPREVELTATEGHLVAIVAGTDSVRLFVDVSTVDCDYLLATGEFSEWMRVWRSPATAPLALRLRIKRSEPVRQKTDTMLFLIKGRG